MSTANTAAALQISLSCLSGEATFSHSETERMESEWGWETQRDMKLDDGGANFDVCEI